MEITATFFATEPLGLSWLNELTWGRNFSESPSNLSLFSSMLLTRNPALCANSWSMYQLPRRIWRRIECISLLQLIYCKSDLMLMGYKGLFILLLVLLLVLLYKGIFQVSNLYMIMYMIIHCNR